MAKEKTEGQVKKWIQSWWYFIRQHYSLEYLQVLSSLDLHFMVSLFAYLAYVGSFWNFLSLPFIADFLAWVAYVRSFP